MRAKDKLMLTVPSLMSLAAMAFFLGGSPVPVAAQSGSGGGSGSTVCYYDGGSYSPGACVGSGCPVNQVQTCEANGTWSTCGVCGGSS